MIDSLLIGFPLCTASCVAYIVVRKQKRDKEMARKVADRLMGKKEPIPQAPTTHLRKGGRGRGRKGHRRR